jgi:hypothetical protein
MIERARPEEVISYDSENSKEKSVSEIKENSKLKLESDIKLEPDIKLEKKKKKFIVIKQEKKDKDISGIQDILVRKRTNSKVSQSPVQQRRNRAKQIVTLSDNNSDQDSSLEIVRESKTISEQNTAESILSESDSSIFFQEIDLALSNPKSRSTGNKKKKKNKIKNIENIDLTHQSGKEKERIGMVTRGMGRTT